MRLLILVVAAAIAAGTAWVPGVSAEKTAAAQQRAGIYVVGALHDLHAETAGFDYEALASIVARTDPEVMVIETRPDELAQRAETPGRPEYPRVIWPYLEQASPAVVVGMEPGGELFDQWVAEGSATLARFNQEQPEDAAYWRRYSEAVESLLVPHWRSPADAHDAVSADLARARYIVRYALAGEAMERIQERWDRYMLEQARKVVTSHPDRRVLVLVSHRNRHRFDEAMRALSPERVVDMEVWLRAR